MANFELLDAVNLKVVRTSSDVAERLGVSEADAARELRARWACLRELRREHQRRCRPEREHERNPFRYRVPLKESQCRHVRRSSVTGAKHAFGVMYDGEQITIPAGEIVREGHPQATARPGEKRGE